MPKRNGDRPQREEQRYVPAQLRIKIPLDRPYSLSGAAPVLPGSPASQWRQKQPRIRSQPIEVTCLYWPLFVPKKDDSVDVSGFFGGSSKLARFAVLCLRDSAGFAPGGGTSSVFIERR